MPVVPVDLLDYTQLPSTYIMGIHSSLREQIDVEMVRGRDRGKEEKGRKGGVGRVREEGKGGKGRGGRRRWRGEGGKYC